MFVPSSAQRRLVTAAAALAVLAIARPSSAEELWKLDTGGEIVFQRLTPLGNLLVSTEMNLRAVNPETGKTLWMRDDVRRLKECNYDEIAGMPYGVVDLGEGMAGAKRLLEVIDLETGKPLWDSRELPIASSQGLFQVPHQNTLILVGAPRKGTRSVLVSVDVATGALRWRQDALFAKPLQLFEVRGSGKVFKRYSVDGAQPPLFDSEDTAILFVSEEGPIKIDLNTGQKLWTAGALAGREPPALRYGYAAMVSGGGRAFVPFGRGLQALGLANGAPLWPKPREFKSAVAQMELIAEGLVVRGAPMLDDKGKLVGKPFVDLLDPETGASKWTQPFKDLDEATTFDIAGDHVYIAADGVLHAIRLADGASRPVASFRFKGNEAPTTLEVVEGNYLLSSSQNLLMLDTEGKVRYHAFYAAPEARGWEKFTSTASSMAATAAKAPSAYARAQRNGSALPTPEVAEHPTLARRLGATAGALSFCSILTNVDQGGHHGPGLVKVEKATGREAGRVLLGDTTPVYELDPIEGRVFFLKSGREIVCYRF